MIHFSSSSCLEHLSDVYLKCPIFYIYSFFVDKKKRVSEEERVEPLRGGLLPFHLGVVWRSPEQKDSEGGMLHERKQPQYLGEAYQWTHNSG